MKSEPVIVSIDGGGTNTRVVIFSNGKQVFKQFEFGVNYKKCSNVADSFQKVFEYVDNMVGINNVDRFVFGLAGIDLEAQKDIDVYKSTISSVLKIDSFDQKVKIVNDIYLVNGLLLKPDEDKIIVICATGSNVLYSNRSVVRTNADIEFHSLGGTRHIVEYFINHVTIDECPDKIREMVTKYKGSDFDKNQLDVIGDFKKASYVLLDNVQNKFCREACLFGIHSMIDAIELHLKGENSIPSIYLYGGQFKSTQYKQLFIDTLKTRGILYNQIIHIYTEAVYGGLAISA